MADSDAVFQEAVEALRAGNKNRARELLTGLLKTGSEQCNLLGMDERHGGYRQGADLLPANRVQTGPSKRRRQTRLDPARRAAADETVQPFPVNRPRAWEEKLLLAHEKPKPKGWAAVKASPVARLGGFVALGVVLIGALVFGFLQACANRNARPATFTPGPSPHLH